MKMVRFLLTPCSYADRSKPCGAILKDAVNDSLSSSFPSLPAPPRQFTPNSRWATQKDAGEGRKGGGECRNTPNTLKLEGTVVIGAVKSSLVKQQAGVAQE